MTAVLMAETMVDSMVVMMADLMADLMVAKLDMMTVVGMAVLKELM